MYKQSAFRVMPPSTLLKHSAVKSVCHWVEACGVAWKRLLATKECNGGKSQDLRSRRRASDDVATAFVITISWCFVLRAILARSQKKE